MFPRLGTFVCRHWVAVIAVWSIALVALSYLAPPWDSITHDGDLAYLPSWTTTQQAEALLERAFPQHRSKSQMAIVITRTDAALTERDLQGPAYDVARRFQNCFAVSAITRARRMQRQAEEARREGRPEAAAKWDQRAELLLTRAEEALGEAIALDGLWVALAAEQGANEPRLGEAFLNRALLYEHLGREAEAQLDRSMVRQFAPELAEADALVPQQAASFPLLDVWTWRDEIFGDKLRSQDGRARLVLLHLSREFLAVGNMELVRFVETQLDQVRQAMRRHDVQNIRVGASGSASVGGDLLLSAKESIDHTELFTVALVVLILALVYRSPLLVAVPLVTIFFSLKISTALVALLTDPAAATQLSWWQLRVFTTSKIFIVVILFGAGTDFCLFLIARCREHLRQGEPPGQAVAAGLGGVGDALTASALTTIFGLCMMVFAEFGKYRYSGPVIGLCLAVTLAACLTLTPALLRGLGGWIDWPARRRSSPADSPAWTFLADRIVARPGRILLATLAVLLPLAVVGVQSAGHVTYDFLATLDPGAPSRRGAELMEESFPVGESGPLIVVAHRPGAEFDTPEGGNQIAWLNYFFYQVPGVATVRSLADPLGECPPAEASSLFSGDAWRARLARPHPRTAELFLAQAAELDGDVTRFDLILQHDPFSLEAVEVLKRVRQQLTELSQQDATFWGGTEFAFSGTTAGIFDLATVTKADNLRIELLVVAAVLLVLLGVLRRPLVSVYLIVSVLLTYYVTVGASELFFQWAYGDDYQGLDWKVPLFLFVILVAIGQDYNVYLVTRVFQEQQRWGGLDGLRLSIVRTGGIITSCGVIMAGTFLSMTSGAWLTTLRQLPALTWLPEAHSMKGIVQLGFALALGVLLDTLVVRPVLVPAFLALLERRTPAASPARAAPSQEG